MRRFVLAVLISVGVIYAQSHGGGSAGGGGHASSGAHGNWNHAHPRTVAVPYAVPYVVGGYGYGYGYAPGYYSGYDPSLAAGYADPSAQGPSDDSGSPSVLVNPYYVPDRANPQVQEYGGPTGLGPDPSAMRMYQNQSYPYANVPPPRPMQRAAPGSDEPTIYLLAFKDHTIVQSLGYWMEGGTLHYVSMEHTLNQASLDLIDRSLSQRLNDERGVEFKLPAK